MWALSSYATSTLLARKTYVKFGIPLSALLQVDLLLGLGVAGKVAVVGLGGEGPPGRERGRAEGGLAAGSEGRSAGDGGHDGLRARVGGGGADWSGEARQWVGGRSDVKQFLTGCDEQGELRSLPMRGGRH